MTRNAPYPSMRLSAKISAHENQPADASTKPDYALIKTLRSVRDDGYEAITAIEHYDPDFSIDLSRCVSRKEADALLDTWLEKRMAVLKHTCSELERTWRESRASSAS